MLIVFLFFFNDTATTEIYTLSLHDALPISLQRARPGTYRVVFTTVHGTEEEQLRGLEAGALDFLVKPISLRVAPEKIKRWGGGGRAGRFSSSSPSPRACCSSRWSSSSFLIAGFRCAGAP